MEKEDLLEHIIDSINLSVLDEINHKGKYVYKKFSDENHLTNSLELCQELDLVRYNSRIEGEHPWRRTYTMSYIGEEVYKIKSR